MNPTAKTALALVAVAITVGHHWQASRVVVPKPSTWQDVQAAPGVPLAEMTLLPGTPTIENGYVRPSDAPGFGLEITRTWLENAASGGA